MSAIDELSEETTLKEHIGRYGVGRFVEKVSTVPGIAHSHDVQAVPYRFQVQPATVRSQTFSDQGEPATVVERIIQLSEDEFRIGAKPEGGWPPRVDDLVGCVRAGAKNDREQLRHL